MGSNKQHKNSVFSFLFNNSDTLRELYSAIQGISLPPDTPVDINTLSDILFMGQINDISFTIDNRLVVLIEHQSTINLNMPLRLLMYIARIYEKIIDRKKLYHTKLEKIPAPEFIVLYNGKEPYPDREALKLSDAFMEAVDLTGSETVSLELSVQVYNINHGCNPDILKKCGTLEGYSFFVEKVRECEKRLSKEESMKAAIKYCIERNILRQFLETHSSEVFNMLLTEWDTEEAKGVWYEEGLEIGLERGREEIARNALCEGFSIETVQKITGLDIEVIKKMQ